MGIRPPGLEPGTYGLEGRCSIQLSYGRSFSAHKTTEVDVNSPRQPERQKREPSLRHRFGQDSSPMLEIKGENSEVFPTICVKIGVRKNTPCSLT